MLGVDFLFYFSFSFLCHLFILLFLSSLTFYFISLEFIIIIILFGYLLYFLFFSYFNFLLVLVASTSSQDFFYKLFSFISVQEGSAFIWYFFFIFGCWVLGFFNTYFVRISSGLFHFLLYLRFFFFCFLFFFSNSFLLVDFFIVDGYSLNLILQNFWFLYIRFYCISHIFLQYLFFLFYYIFSFYSFFPGRLCFFIVSILLYIFFCLVAFVWGVFGRIMNLVGVVGDFEIR